MPELQRDEQKVDLFTEYDAKRAKIKADVLEADLHAQMETMFMYKETINILRDIVDDKPNILNEKYDTWEKKLFLNKRWNMQILYCLNFVLLIHVDVIINTLVVL